ncbi:hypothetical protein D3C80_1336620 [compost metagenome]
MSSKTMITKRIMTTITSIMIMTPFKVFGVRMKEGVWAQFGESRLLPKLAVICSLMNPV